MTGRDTAKQARASHARERGHRPERRADRQVPHRRIARSAPVVVSRRAPPAIPRRAPPASPRRGSRPDIMARPTRTVSDPSRVRRLEPAVARLLDPPAMRNSTGGVLHRLGPPRPQWPANRHAPRHQIRDRTPHRRARRRPRDPKQPLTGRALCGPRGRICPHRSLTLALERLVGHH